MNSRSVTLCFLFINTVSLYSQDSSRYTAKWITRPSIGISIPLNDLLSGSITDDLIGYNDAPASYLQIISIAYFFHDRWGVEINYQGSTLNNITGRSERFHSAINSEHEADFFVTPSTGAEYDTYNLVEGDIGRFYLGLIYRIEFGGFLIYPKLAIGYTSFDTDWGEAYLKSKNSNSVRKIQYWSEDHDISTDAMTISPSILVGYKLSRRVFANLEMTTSFARAKVTYIETTTDLYTEQVTTEKYHYKKTLSTLGIGAGLIIVLGFRD
jgi:hypothetical protein